MRNAGYILCGLYFVAKTYARYYLYRPIPRRPLITRSNEALHTIDWAGWAAWMAAFFFLLNPARPAEALLLTAVLFLYDPLIRLIFIQWEVRRLRRKSPDRKWSYRDARRRVRRRAVAAMFH